MAPGMMFTIEPMVNMGTHKIQCGQENELWTVYKANDKSLQLSGKSRFLSQKMDMRRQVINDE